MRWFTAPDYWFGRLAFERGLAVIYLIAFIAAARQFRGLLGERGLLPIPRYLRRVGFWQAPSLFQFHYSDRFFAIVACCGAAFAAAMAAGLGDAVPLWASMLAWLALWALYLSIVNVGQVWYGFGCCRFPRLPGSATRRCGTRCSSWPPPPRWWCSATARPATCCPGGRS